MTEYFARLIYIVLGLFAFAAGADQPSPVPQIEFTSRVYQFGQIRPGLPVDYSFIFSNTGSAVLVVSNVQPFCGCTTAGNWTKQVNPGRAGVIPLRLDTKRVSGPVNVMVHVLSNDPEQPEVALKLTGKIWRMVDANPPYALFNLDQNPGTNATQFVDITNNDNQAVSLSAPAIDVTNFIVSLATNVAGWDYRLSVRLASLDEPAHVQGLITLKTSCLTEPILPISAIIVRPSSILVTNPGYGQNTSQIQKEAMARLGANQLQWLDDQQTAELFHDQRYTQHRFVFIDARSDEDYHVGHIPGAYQFNPYHPQKDQASVLPVCRRAERVVVYCTGADCDDSETAAIALRQAGVDNHKLFVYINGMMGWTERHLPIETGK